MIARFGHKRTLWWVVGLVLVVMAAVHLTNPAPVPENRVRRVQPTALQVIIMSLEGIPVAAFDDKRTLPFFWELEERGHSGRRSRHPDFDREWTDLESKLRSVGVTSAHETIPDTETPRQVRAADCVLLRFTCEDSPDSELVVKGVATPTARRLHELDRRARRAATELAQAGTIIVCYGDRDGCRVVAAGPGIATGGNPRGVAPHPLDLAARLLGVVESNGRATGAEAWCDSR